MYLGKLVFPLETAEYSRSIAREVRRALLSLSADGVQGIQREAIRLHSSHSATRSAFYFCFGYDARCIGRRDGRTSKTFHTSSLHSDTCETTRPQICAMSCREKKLTTRNRACTPFASRPLVCKVKIITFEHIQHVERQHGHF